MSSANLSASAARNACLVDAADLVKITSMGENSFVHSLILGEAWIGLERDTQGGAFHWKDGANVSFSQWSGSRGSNPCVVMDVNGDWKTLNCFNNAPKYVCEKGMGNDCFTLLEKSVSSISSRFECALNILLPTNGSLVHVVCPCMT